MKKIVVAGSRGFNDYEKICEVLDDYDLTPEDEIVSGTARGTDRLGERYAEEHSIKIKRFQADWNKYGKKAVYLRNEEIAKYCTEGVIFWDGDSKGTKHMINLLSKHNKFAFIKIYTDRKEK